jgi:tetratricopeptide (TPR) repeat protein
MPALKWEIETPTVSPSNSDTLRAVWKVGRLGRCARRGSFINWATPTLLLMAPLWTMAATAPCCTADDYYSRGQKEFSKRHWNGAIADFTKAIRLRPDHAEAYYWRGVAQNSKGAKSNPLEAIADFTQAIQLKPDYADAYFSRGYVKKLRGDLDGAIADCSRAIGLKQALAYLPGCKIEPKSTSRAVVEFDPPHNMTWRSGEYQWDATFRETGGKSGFRLTATDFYILSVSGAKWSNNWRPSVDVKAGGSADVHWWVDRSEKWAGGKFHCIWGRPRRCGILHHNRAVGVDSVQLKSWFRVTACYRSPA